jgi:hypothetical protein
MWNSQGKLYVSSLCATPCDHSMRFSYDGTQVDLDFEPWSGMEAEIGTLIHNLWQDIFLANGIYSKIEEKISIDIPKPDGGLLKINMKIDGVMKEDGSLDELKTVGVKDYNITEPIEKHREQLNMYLGVKQQNKGTIKYFKRENGSHLADFVIVFDPELFRSTIERIVRILNNDLKYDKSSCFLCPYKTKCKKDLTK